MVLYHKHIYIYHINVRPHNHITETLMLDQLILDDILYIYILMFIYNTQSSHFLDVLIL